MRKQILRGFMSLSLFAILAVASVYGQSHDRLEVNVPFDFIASSTRFPAGKYTVQSLSMTGGHRALLIRSAEGREGAIITTSPVQAKEKQDGTKLVFNRYGDRYFLSQVWTGSIGRQLFKSRAERELAKGTSKHLAKDALEPKVVTVTAQ